MPGNQAKNPPRYSVVIPVKDDPLAAEAVASVTAQTHRALEVIVVDDGSDEPLRLESNDPRVRVIRNEQPLGPAGARNVGVEASNGDILAFLDSDDLFGPRRLEIVSAWHQYADIVALRASVTRPRRLLDRGELLESTAPHLGQTTVARNKFSLFDASYSACEDLDWWIRACQAQFDSILLVPDDGSWEWRPGDHPRVLHGSSARLAHSRRLLEDHAGFFDVHRRARAFRLLRVASLSRQHDQLRAATSALLRSTAASPTQGHAIEGLRIARHALSTLTRRGTGAD